MLSFLVEGAGEGSNIMRVSVLIDRECLSTERLPLGCPLKI